MEEKARVTILLSANYSHFMNQGPEIRQKHSLRLCHLHIFI